MVIGENMSDGGKGDKQRPTDPVKWDNGYDRIWGNKKKEISEAEEKLTRNNDETQEVLQNMSR
jgi:hypothetical protein